MPHKRKVTNDFSVVTRKEGLVGILEDGLVVGLQVLVSHIEEEVWYPCITQWPKLSVIYYDTKFEV